MLTVYSDDHQLHDSTYELCGGIMVTPHEVGLPTVFVLEGGYAVEEISISAVNVLTGFEQAAE